MANLSSKIGVSGVVTEDDYLDEDNMVSNSDTKLATQQSIKAYVDDSVLSEAEATDLAIKYAIALG